MALQPWLASDEQIERVMARVRVPQPRFIPAAFGGTVAALVFAPLAAEENLFRSYLPYLILRVWMVGFALYGYSLARAAAARGRFFRPIFVGIGIAFFAFWGLKVEVWLVIDWLCAILISIGMFFLKTQPAGNLATDPSWRQLFRQELDADLREQPHTTLDHVVKRAVRRAYRKYHEGARRHE